MTYEPDYSVKTEERQLTRLFLDSSVQCCIETCLSSMFDGYQVMSAKTLITFLPASY